MKIVTVLMHLAVDDDYTAQETATALKRGQCQVSYLTERPLENGMDLKVEFGVEEFIFNDRHGSGSDAAVHRQVLLDLAQPDENRSRRRWARIRELHQQWKAGWPESDGKKKQKGQPSFYETAEGEAIAAEMSWLHDLERHTACVLDFPVWQERQHTEVLIDGVLLDAEVFALDIPHRTVTVAIWPHEDLMASLAVKSQFQEVTVEQIEAGIAENERLDDARRQARLDEESQEKKKPGKTVQPKTARKSAQPALDLFSSVPAAE